MSQKTIAAEIAELDRLTVPELVKRFEALWGYAPRIRHKTYLFRRCAWRLQQQRLGGLSPEAKEKLEELVADLQMPLGNQRSIRGSVRAWPQNIPKPGTVLIRNYKGQEVHVTVREDGFEWEGLTYRSLSAAAQAITGAKWNGKHFFGLTPRSKKS
jgi:DUF2924 family protein